MEIAPLRTSLKFELSEKHTKFEKNFLMVLKNRLIYLVYVKTMRKTFSNSESLNFTKMGVAHTVGPCSH